MIRTILTFVALLGALPAMAATLPNEPVRTLDMTRYVGQWHDIAHLPMYFQRKCLSAVTATYSANPDGTLRVQNTCRTRKGIESTDGVAKIDSDRPGAFKVRFAPAWLSWLPLSWAEYWVIDVDPDYQWAVVGSQNRKHMWILARTPTMDRQLFERIVARAKQRGYDVSRLKMMAPLN